MLTIRRTTVFQRWLDGLRDVRAVGDGVREMRIDYGPGYRVCFVQRGTELIILLCGGDNGTQERDIAAAKVLAREV